jgi:hypothetical protein
MPSFPNGLRGFALLWLRAAAAFALAQNAASLFFDGETLRYIPISVSALCLGVGFLTPLVGLVVTIAEIAWMLSHREEIWRSSYLITSILIALTVLGPGAYSMDRWLFGRKRLTIGRSPH